MASLAKTFVVTVMAMLKAVFSTVFTFDRHQALYRSAVLMIIFTVVHALGNLTFFLGPGAMNRYGHKLVSNPFIKVIEVYLLLTLLVHVLAAGYNTLKDGRLKAQWTWRSLSLSLTGGLLLVFLALHLQHFKYGPHYRMVTSDKQVVRDLHRLVVEAFADPWYCSFYVVSIGALLLHLLGGWKRAVLRLGIPKQYRTGARALGETLAFLVSAAYVGLIAYAHFDAK